MNRILIIACFTCFILLSVSPGVFCEDGLGIRVEWVTNLSDVSPDRDFGSGYMSCQTVWDIDGDGVNEIVMATSKWSREDRFWCLDEKGRFEWVYPPLEEDSLPGRPYSKASLVDVDGDGVEEVCFSDFSGRLHVLRGNGSVLWTWDTPDPEGSINGAPQAMDVDGDGFVEFFLHAKHGRVYRVDHNGELVWTSAQATKGGMYAQPTICDLDKDGLYEVLWNPYHCNIYCTDAGTGLNKWVYEGSTNPPVIVADVNNDGEYEIITWNEIPPGVICLNYLGEKIWEWIMPLWPDEYGVVRMCQAICDVDKDGEMDLVLISKPGVYCLNISDQTPEVKWFANFTAWGEEGIIPEGAICRYWDSYQLIVDFDGDSELEILWLVPYPLVVDAASGRLEAYYWHADLLTGARAENGGWWGDVDRDGVSEWVCELREYKNHWLGARVYCLTMGGRFPAESPWPEFYHCAYPGYYQAEQSWLTLKAAYSNSLWFPIRETTPKAIHVISLILLPALLQRRHT